MLGSGEVQLTAFDATSLGLITLWRLTSENGLAKVVEFGEQITDGLDVGRLDGIAQPLHLCNSVLDNNPVVAHDGASTVTEVGKEIHVGTVGTIERASNNLIGLIRSLVNSDIWVAAVSVSLSALNNSVS